MLHKTGALLELWQYFKPSKKHKLKFWCNYGQ
jgi:hypothetical protein